MKKHSDVPWYRWRFSLVGLFLILFFGFSAWGTVANDKRECWFRFLGGLSFLSLAAWVAWQEWKYRKGMRFLLRKKSNDENA